MGKIIQDYTLTQKIGQGQYGSVYRAEHKTKPGYFAVKAIPIQKFQQVEKLEECTNNQIQTLTLIGQSPHIIIYYEKFKTKTNYYFVYQYCNGGNLKELLFKKQKILEKDALKIFRQLLEAFKVLNKYNIMHRDLKPENIFFHDNKIKVGDFGFCKGLKPDENLTKTMLGSPIYMAPQVLKGQMYTTKADIWSMGVMLFQMLYGICPFQSKSIAMLINTIENCNTVNLPSQPKIKQKTQNLIKRMLTKDYFRRIGWAELFSIKINQQGQYIQENALQVKTPYHQSQVTQSKSFSEIKNNITSVKKIENQPVSAFNIEISQTEQKKTASVPKAQKKKCFYSQNFLDLFSSKDIKFQLKTSEKANENQMPSKLQFLTENKISYQNKPRKTTERCSYEYNKIESSKKKREQLINRHEQVVQRIKNALQKLQSNGSSNIPQAYLSLKYVHQLLKKTTQQIKITETNLLDMASIANYELIQVDRMLIQLRNQMVKHELQIPHYTSETNFPIEKVLQSIG